MNTNKPYEALSSLEVNAVIDFFMHYISQDQRRLLAEAYPQAYNKLCGDKVVRVAWVRDE